MKSGGWWRENFGPTLKTNNVRLLLNLPAWAGLAHSLSLCKLRKLHRQAFLQQLTASRAQWLIVS